jgi:hypothetical protein
MKGIGSNGMPELETRWVWDNPNAPHIRSTQLEGRPSPTSMQVTLDPLTGVFEQKPIAGGEERNVVTQRQQAVADKLAALRIVDELEGTVNRSGTYENGFLGNPEDSAALDQIPPKLSMAMARAMNPGNAPTESQVEIDRKYMVPLGMMASKAKALAALKNLRKDLTARSGEMGLEPDLQKHFAERKLAFPDVKSAEAAAAAGKIPEGEMVMIGDQINVWHAKK